MFSASLGFEYLVLSEPDGQELDNLRWISGSRFADIGYVAGLEKLKAILSSGPATIAEIESHFSPEENCRPILFRGLWELELSFDRFKPIETSTQVWIDNER